MTHGGRGVAEKVDEEEARGLRGVASSHDGGESARANPLHSNHVRRAVEQEPHRFGDSDQEETNPLPSRGVGDETATDRGERDNGFVRSERREHGEDNDWQRQHRARCVDAHMVPNFPLPDIACSKLAFA